MLALAALALSLTLVAGMGVAEAHEPSRNMDRATDGAHAPTADNRAASSTGAIAPSTGDLEATRGSMSQDRRRAATGVKWPWAPSVALGAGLTWVVLRAWRGPARAGTTRRAAGSTPDGAARGFEGTAPAPDPVLSAALAVTGMVHLLEAPSHWAEGWHLGLFFAASGAVLLGQAIAARTRADAQLYRCVLVTTLSLVLLYVLAREVSLPLVDHRDPYLLSELPVKAIELGIAGLSVLRLIRGRDRLALAQAALAPVGVRPGRSTPEYRAVGRRQCAYPGTCNRL